MIELNIEAVIRSLASAYQPILEISLSMDQSDIVLRVAEDSETPGVKTAEANSASKPAVLIRDWSYIEVSGLCKIFDLARVNHLAELSFPTRPSH